VEAAPRSAGPGEPVLMTQPPKEPARKPDRRQAFIETAFHLLGSARHCIRLPATPCIERALSFARLRLSTTTRAAWLTRGAAPRSLSPQGAASPDRIVASTGPAEGHISPCFQSPTIQRYSRSGVPKAQPIREEEQKLAFRTMLWKVTGLVSRQGCPSHQRLCSSSITERIPAHDDLRRHNYAP
jgi:hypothetical protein